MQKAVLLVEDDERILHLLEDALDDTGFRVLAARDGESASQAIDELHGTIAVLVTDVNLGTGICGLEVARRARASNPDLEVIFITGEVGVQATSEAAPRSQFLQKPFRPDRLVEAVTSAIGVQD